MGRVLVLLVDALDTEYHFNAYFLHFLYAQWLLMNTNVPAHGIDKFDSINAYDKSKRGNVSPGAPALITAGVKHAFNINSYFWYVLCDLTNSPSFSILLGIISFFLL